MEPFYLIVIGVVVLVFLFMAIINRYRRCPSDKILVIYGSKSSTRSAKCIHGGGAFVWPIIEDYAYLSLTPIGIDANLTNALSRQNIRVDVPCRFTVGISTEPESMLAAAERLLGQSAQQIQELARDILFGQLLKEGRKRNDAVTSALVYLNARVTAFQTGNTDGKRRIPLWSCSFRFFGGGKNVAGRCADYQTVGILAVNVYHIFWRANPFGIHVQSAGHSVLLVGGDYHP